MAPPELLSKLVTVIPPWCDPAGDSINSLESEPAPEPFRLTLPHPIRRSSRLWELLSGADTLDNKTLKNHVDSIASEIKDYQKQDSVDFYGLSKTIVIKYGETSLRILRRVLDLHLVYNHSPEIPGNDPGIFDQSTWLTTIRNTVLFRMHYAEDFKILNHDQVKKGVYVTDVLVLEHRDRVERARMEREVFTSMVEELTQEDLKTLPGYKATALGTAPLSSLKRCAQTVEAFYNISDEKEDILENEDQSDMRYYQAFQLWHIAARAAMTWETPRYGETHDVLSQYCKDIVRRRKTEKRNRNAELREQLEAILGDTRGEQGGMSSEAEESEDESEDESENESENESSSDSESSDEADEDNDDDGLPIFGHYT
ncbi:hypothetical protein FHETE_8121 [Fusarium heterosporum]|uniref:Uncharacterized protein n=1 Tax=Fusarium heterosporum TaxID=42747 RepID=A0A8H5T043_FUSHE|nr:hypothetical protein FHETE_8121 [Fusarium heterosporum]